MSNLISVNDTNFDRFISDQQAVIVDFWSPSCIPCRSIEKNLEIIANQYGSKVKILKVNVNESPKTSSKFLVRGLPTLLFLKNGNVQTQIVGAVTPIQIEKKLQEVM
jgi:thioredoxin